MIKYPLAGGASNHTRYTMMLWHYFITGFTMGLGKQAKTLTVSQVTAISRYLAAGRNGQRNQLIFMLSVKAGLRAKEIANLKWSMLLTQEGKLSDSIHLTNHASKGKSGRIIPLNKDLRKLLQQHLESTKLATANSYVINTERSSRTSARAIVNLFAQWYRRLGYEGCSSHSGRRTFITNVSRKISTVGGSLRDVQALAGHKNLQTTQRYIEQSSKSQQKVVNLL